MFDQLVGEFHERRHVGPARAPCFPPGRDLLDAALPFRSEQALDVLADAPRKPRALAVGGDGDQKIAAAGDGGVVKVAPGLAVLDIHQDPHRPGRGRKGRGLVIRRAGNDEQLHLGKLCRPRHAPDESCAGAAR